MGVRRIEHFPAPNNVHLDGEQAGTRTVIQWTNRFKTILLGIRPIQEGCRYWTVK